MCNFVNIYLYGKKNKYRLRRDKQKRTNRRLSYWTNGEIKKVIINKSTENGVFLCGVNAYHTSQQCSHCGYQHEDNRNGKFFKCKKCGFMHDSDLNAAINIRNRLSTDQSRLQILVKNIVKYWKTNQSESELLKMLKYV